MAINPGPPTLEHRPRAWLLSRCAATPWRLSVWASKGAFVEPENPTPEYYPHYSMHLVTEGAIEYVIGSTPTTVRKNQLALFPRRTSRYAKKSGRRRAALSYVHFEPALDRPDPLRAVKLPLVVTMQKPSAAARTMSKLINTNDTTGEKRLLAQAELLRMLHTLIVDGFETGQLGITHEHVYPDALVRGMTMIETDVFNPDLALQHVAEAVGLSQGHFTRLFREHVGLPPKTYLMHRRLDQAMTLVLTEPNMPIREIATACGYVDPFYFSIQFRKRFGRAPTAFRQASPPQQE